MTTDPPSYLESAQLYTDRVITWLEMGDVVEDELIRADLDDFTDIYINALNDQERIKSVDYIKSRINGNLPKELRLPAEHLFFGQGTGANEYDPLAELAEAVGVLPRGATWADMAEHIGPISWAWDGWLPNGFLTIVAGEVGQGKSVLCLRVAACFLRGDKWPNGTDYAGELGAVVWCEAEAAQALNLERAKAWGLPLEKLYTPLDDPLADVQLDESEHHEAVRELVHRPDVRLAVVDSLRGVHRHDENSSVSIEVVKLLAELARNTGKPILLTHHLRKRGVLDVGDRVTLDRIRGSSAIIQTARMVWAIDAPDATEEDHKRLSTIKSNLGRFPQPVGFTIGHDASLVFGEAPETPKQETAVDKAADLLKALLADGPVASVDLRDEAQGAGISWDSMKKAKNRLGVVAKRDGQTKRWTWALPIKEGIPAP